MEFNTSYYSCESCGSEMQSSITSWHFVCKFCGFERSSLQKSINSLNEMNEEKRELGLKPIRQHNFQILLNWITSILGTTNGRKKTLLDVGSAHGWFVEMAGNNFLASGIEPDEHLAHQSLKRNLDIRIGYFPNCLQPEELFDVIIFNDVLEHIPNVLDVLRNCEKKLSLSGLLIINAPNSCGILYRVTKFLTLFGFKYAFNRMWQVGLPSPHVYYFNDKTIEKLACKAGLTIIGKISLPSTLIKGLYSRFTFVNNNLSVFNIFFILPILILTFFLRLFHSDISAWAMMRKP